MALLTGGAGIGKRPRSRSLRRVTKVVLSGRRGSAQLSRSETCRRRGIRPRGRCQRCGRRLDRSRSINSAASTSPLTTPVSVKVRSDRRPKPNIAAFSTSTFGRSQFHASQFQSCSKMAAALSSIPPAWPGTLVSRRSAFTLHRSMRSKGDKSVALEFAKQNIRINAVARASSPPKCSIGLREMNCDRSPRSLQSDESAPAKKSPQQFSISLPTPRNSRPARRWWSTEASSPDEPKTKS